MCLSVPGQVVDVRDGHDDRGPTARVEIAGVRRTVDAGLVADELRPGDWVLVHLGFVLGRIDEAEARRTRALLDGLRDAELPSAPGAPDAPEAFAG